MQSIAYELKYCERCGTLGLRRTACEQSYCEPCEQALLNFDLSRQTPWLSRLLARKSQTTNGVKPVPGAQTQLPLAGGRLQ